MPGIDRTRSEVEGVTSEKDKMQVAGSSNAIDLRVLQRNRTNKRYYL